VHPLLRTDLPYDPARDVAPITLLFRATLLVVVGRGSRFASVADLVAEARRSPGRVSYASLGNGHPMHLAVEALASAAGVDLLHVPFSDGGTLMAAVANGDVDFTTLGMNAIAGMRSAGRLVALAVGADTRLPDHPALPTIAESGGPRVEMRPWAALVGVTGTPAEIVEQIRRDVTAALSGRTARTAIANAGYEVLTSTPGELALRVAAEARSAAALIRSGRVQGGA
jgi:tripartite-type tricarboxylate transporter receptor subunit TctC